MSEQSEESGRLSKQLSIRVTEEEYNLVHRMAKADARKAMDMGRKIFRRGLPLEEDDLRARGFDLDTDDGIDEDDNDN